MPAIGHHQSSHATVSEWERSRGRLIYCYPSRCLMLPVDKTEGCFCYWCLYCSERDSAGTVQGPWGCLSRNRPEDGYPFCELRNIQRVAS